MRQQDSAPRQQDLTEWSTAPFTRRTPTKRLRLAAGLLAIIAATSACSSSSNEPSSLPATDNSSELTAEEVQVAADEHPTYFEPVAEQVEPTLDSPEEAVAAAEEELEDAGVEAEADEEIPEATDVLAEVEPVDEIDVDVAVVVERDGQRRNETGELFTLDQSASLACGDIEIALAYIDEGDNGAASDRIRSAADRVGQSEFGSVSDWSETLSAANKAQGSDLSSLVGFMTTCTQGGYEL